MTRVQLQQMIVKQLPLMVLLCVAGALKAFYSQASAGELRWILAPIALCVELLTGRQFVFDGNEGYCLADQSATIAPVCAGVNFMIILICMMGTMLRKRVRGIAGCCSMIFGVLLAAYLATICINTLRIIAALELYDANVQFGYLTKERIHRFMGIAVYFSGACGVSYLVNRLKAPVHCGSTRPQWLLPAAWYLGITLGIPLLLGKVSRNSGLFFEHAAIAVVIPLLLVIITYIYKRTSGARKIKGALQ